MNEKALELFLKNYNNEGICADLPKYLKKIEKKYKSGEIKEIPYYPWAVIERLFRMQGGKLEVLEWAKTETVTYTDYIMDENDGTAKLAESKAFPTFIHLRGTWQDETLDEFYPLFDSATAKTIKAPDGMDLNNSRQRGGVRLIARLSGIGLNIFEQYDGEEGTKNEPTTVKVEPKKETITSKFKKPLVEKVADIVEKLEEEDAKKVKEKPADIDKNARLAELIEAAKAPPANIVYNEEFDIDSVEHSDLLIAIRTAIKKQGIYTQDVKAFLTDILKRETLGTSKWSELQQLIAHFGIIIESK